LPGRAFSRGAEARREILKGAAAGEEKAGPALKGRIKQAACGGAFGNATLYSREYTCTPATLTRRPSSFRPKYCPVSSICASNQLPE
jgi:hypothetical protein